MFDFLSSVHFHFHLYLSSFSIIDRIVLAVLTSSSCGFCCYSHCAAMQSLSWWARELMHCLCSWSCLILRGLARSWVYPLDIRGTGLSWPSVMYSVCPVMSCATTFWSLHLLTYHFVFCFVFFFSFSSTPASDLVAGPGALSAADRSWNVCVDPSFPVIDLIFWLRCLSWLPQFSGYAH